MAKKKKEVEHICGNCRIYDPERGVCRVVVLLEGKRVNVPVDPQDACIMEDSGLIDDIKEVRFWVEDEKGEKTDGNGTVKIQYPEGFFGDTTIRDILG